MIFHTKYEKPNWSAGFDPKAWSVSHQNVQIRCGNCGEIRVHQMTAATIDYEEIAEDYKRQLAATWAHLHQLIHETKKKFGEEGAALFYREGLEDLAQDLAYLEDRNYHEQGDEDRNIQQENKRRS